ncbi:uncharacterized protein LOC115765470 [Drosophila novamexicana]|uniref:uncharacterized protein LOC115765470 n=1 Tax=Drosophila novamexicana TaxID=47314 RepID=UPI0011E59009|nr:uncharacterized protein LOC115765470 [Drosophila novamexicana]
MNNNNEALELICATANSLFPELNVRLNEVSHPTEAFLTKVLIHYLRSFGFRMEPPYNIENEAKDTSREKRQFLSKLCRQVERIVQISFPGKMFTYMDIIEPTAKKTSSTLDVLFNYRCFYKMHKKEVLSPIVEQHKERQFLIAAITSKRNELEQSKQRAAQIKVDIGKAQANIARLHDQLPKAEAELHEQSRILRQKQAEFALQEEQLAEITNQVQHFKQLLVQDSDVADVEAQNAQIVARIKSCKEEMAKQEELYKERRVEIETNQLLNDEIEKTMQILPPEVLDEYKEQLKLKERMEKKHAAVLSKHQGFLAVREKQKQQIELCEKELKALKLQYEQDALAPKQKLAEQEAEINQQTESVEELEQGKIRLQNQIDEEQRTAEHIKLVFTKIVDERTL